MTCSSGKEFRLGPLPSMQAVSMSTLDLQRFNSLRKSTTPPLSSTVHQRRLSVWSLLHPQRRQRIRISIQCQMLDLETMPFLQLDPLEDLYLQVRRRCVLLQDCSRPSKPFLKEFVASFQLVWLELTRMAYHFSRLQAPLFLVGNPNYRLPLGCHSVHSSTHINVS